MFDVSGTLKDKDKNAARKWIREIRNKLGLSCTKFIWRSKSLFQLIIENATHLKNLKLFIYSRDKMENKI